MKDCNPCNFAAYAKVAVEIQEIGGVDRDVTRGSGGSSRVAGKEGVNDRVDITCPEFQKEIWQVDQSINGL